MQRRSFTFNQDTFEYEPVRLQWRDYLRHAGIASGLGLLLAVAFVMGYTPIYGDLEASWVQKQNTALETELAALSLSFSKVENQLDKIHQNDNNFYRSLLNIQRLDPQVWNAGIGGDEAEDASKPFILRKLAVQTNKLDYKIETQQKSFANISEITAAKVEELQCLPAIKPMTTAIISQFGYRRDPFHGHSAFHSGLDFRAYVGQPIKVTGDGVVVIAGTPESGYGIQIEVDHGYGFRTKYAHLSKLQVIPGQRVKRGDVIGLAGSTGRSTGPHLHYEVIRNGRKVNPIDYFYQ
jgi:murein DD-endopeptidase MepM/ murein hydrolase activator NlpD